MRARSLPNDLLLSVLVWAALLTSVARADEISSEQRQAVRKGLQWLAKTQHKDGHWEATASGRAKYPEVMTAISGMAMLMEGSTIRDGQYKNNIRRAADWLMERSQANGMIGTRESQERYMYGHGFGMLFLACVVGEEEDGDRRRRLVDILERACKFSLDAQTQRGGWGYISAKEGLDFDEGSVTITQVQALRAARNAGIAVPQEAIKKAQKYLADATTSEGGVGYSLTESVGGRGVGRPALTAAAIACGFSFGDYTSPLVKKWFLFCQRTLPPLATKSQSGGPQFPAGARLGHDEYTHYYYAQALYVLGEDGYARLFPDSKPSARLTWSRYKKENFQNILRAQSAEGSWTGSGSIMWIEAHFTTPVYLTILQLDNAALPIYQR